ncbi:MAG: recombination regulator RecX [Chloroflexota bacterium]|nr:recombination regulator RecX [Chloroflexota bacterium]
MAPSPAGGRITAITPQRRTPDRLNIFLDGVYAFSLATALVADEGLAPRQELTAARVATLLAADSVSKATEAALRFLAVRPRSERELRDRLRSKQFTPDEIAAALERVRGWGYLDDIAFARFWVAQRETYRPRGQRLLRHELAQKGVDRDLIVATIAEAEIDEPTAALELARGRLLTYRGLEPHVVRRRLGAFLARRGYGYDVIGPTLEVLLSEGRDTEDRLKSCAE